MGSALAKVVNPTSDATVGSASNGELKEMNSSVLALEARQREFDGLLQTLFVAKKELSEHLEKEYQRIAPLLVAYLNTQFNPASDKSKYKWEFTGYPGELCSKIIYKGPNRGILGMRVGKGHPRVAAAEALKPESDRIKLAFQEKLAGKYDINRENGQYRITDQKLFTALCSQDFSKPIAFDELLKSTMGSPVVEAQSSAPVLTATM